MNRVNFNIAKKQIAVITAIDLHMTGHELERNSRLVANATKIQAGEQIAKTETTGQNKDDVARLGTAKTPLTRHSVAETKQDKHVASLKRNKTWSVYISHFMRIQRWWTRDGAIRLQFVPVIVIKSTAM